MTSNTEINSWEVFFKIPEVSSTKMKRFFIKIEGHDVYCVHDPKQTIDTLKLKFLHCLLGCTFTVKPPEDPSAAAQMAATMQNSKTRNQKSEKAVAEDDGSNAEII